MIGVVTSPAAAALRDVLDVLQRRYPLAEVVLSPTPVQGADAPPRIVQALRAVSEFAQPDVILLVRGGGSIEDLAAFNDEDLAYAISRSPVPVVSGVGHETDFTIADFVADQRAPTPSAAAEIASPDREELEDRLERLKAEMAGGVRGRVLDLKRSLAGQMTHLGLASPRAQLANASQRVDDFQRRLAGAMGHDLALKQSDVRRLDATLQAVGPPAVLARGYALVTRQDDGSLVRSSSQVTRGDAIRVRVQDGSFGSEVIGGSEDDVRSE